MSRNTRPTTPEERARRRPQVEVEESSPLPVTRYEGFVLRLLDDIEERDALLKPLIAFADEADRPGGTRAWGPKFDAAVDVARKARALLSAPCRVQSLDAINDGTLVEVHGRGLGGGWKCTRCAWTITEGLPPSHECLAASRGSAEGEHTCTPETDLNCKPCSRGWAAARHKEDTDAG